MKEYPLRPKPVYHKMRANICECGHRDIYHKKDDMVLTSYPPQYIYLQCETCTCPKYDHEKTYKECLDCGNE